MVIFLNGHFFHLQIANNYCTSNLASDFGFANANTDRAKSDEFSWLDCIPLSCWVFPLRSYIFKY